MHSEIKLKPQVNMSSELEHLLKRITKLSEAAYSTVSRLTDSLWVATGVLIPRSIKQAYTARIKYRFTIGSILFPFTDQKTVFKTLFALLRLALYCSKWCESEY
jgi:hypothetical protein